MARIRRIVFEGFLRAGVACCPSGVMAGLFVASFAMMAQSWTYEARVMEGTKALGGVRVTPDRLLKIAPDAIPTSVLTDSEGRFKMALKGQDDVLIFEKSGYGRNFVPLAELKETVFLEKAPHHHVERALVVRLSYPGQLVKASDDAMRALLFSRQPGQASVANYFYEISKGSLELEEGAILHLMDTLHPPPRTDKDCQSICEWVLEQLQRQDLRDFDLVNNRTGQLGPDGKPDHLWIMPPGPAKSATTDPNHMTPVSFLLPCPKSPAKQWGVVFMPDETPLGSMVHECLHAMGEHRVDDLYMTGHQPLTAGIWDVMDAGQYRGWDALVAPGGAWQSLCGYSPSHPTGWVRAGLWYRGAFSRTVSSLTVSGGAFEGWLDPIMTFPGGIAQRLIVMDPRGSEAKPQRPRQGKRRVAGQGTKTHCVFPGRAEHPEISSKITVRDPCVPHTQPAGNRFAKLRSSSCSSPGKVSPPTQKRAKPLFCVHPPERLQRRSRPLKVAVLNNPDNRWHWEFEVRRPWGFERGRVGGRNGPGQEGLVVMRVQPALLSENGSSLGPLRVIDAHPGTKEPPPPRFPSGRWELDDAAFNLGKGEVSGGSDGPLHWEVLATDRGGRMKVRVWLDFAVRAKEKK